MSVTVGFKLAVGQTLRLSKNWRDTAETFCFSKVITSSTTSLVSGWWYKSLNGLLIFTYTFVFVQSMSV